MLEGLKNVVEEELEIDNPFTIDTNIILKYTKYFIMVKPFSI